MGKNPYRLFSKQFMCEFPRPHDLWIMNAFGIGQAGGRRGLQATGNAVAIRYVTQFHKTPTIIINPMHRGIDAFRSSPTKLPDSGVCMLVAT